MTHKHTSCLNPSRPVSHIYPPELWDLTEGNALLCEKLNSILGDVGKSEERTVRWCHRHKKQQQLLLSVHSKPQLWNKAQKKKKNTEVKPAVSPHSDGII